MPIKFNCPQCKRALSVKDELAGRRAACPVCRKPLTIPAPTSAPADLEELAASAFADEPAAPAAAPEKGTIDFTCPFCDEELHLSANLEGKQTPCPECRRIIKVPLIVKNEPKDWRKVQKRGPTGALLPEEPALEGAWSSAAKASVSREALEETGAIPVQREPVTVGQWVKRGALAAGGIAVLVFGWVFLSNYWSKGLQEKALAQALSYAEGKEKVKLSPTAAGAVYRGVGEFHLRDNKLEEATRGFQTARAKARDGSPTSAERDALLIEVALAQVDLGGSAKEVDDDLRLSWAAVARLLQETLGLINDPEVKVEAAREVCRKLIARNQGPLAAALVNSLAPPAAPADGGEPKEPEPPGDAGGKKQPPKPAAKDDNPPPFGHQAVALLVALHQPETVEALFPPPPDKGKPDLAARLARSGSWLKDRKLDQGRTLFARAQAPTTERLSCLLSIAVYAFDQNQADEARACVEEAGKIVAAARKDLKSSPWLLTQWARLAARTGQEQQAQSLAEAVSDPALRGWVRLELFRAEAEADKDLAEDSWSKAVPDKGSLARGLALQAFARHKARRGGGAEALKAIDALEEEKLRPLGYVGVALGVQDRGR